MSDILSRRAFLSVMSAAVVGCTPKAKQTPGAPGILAAIEQRIGGRLGVFATTAKDGVIFSHRASERFAMCSTFKWSLVAAVLVKVDRAEIALTEDVAFGEQDLLEYAPTTREHVGRGRMTVQELCEAAVTVSDNTAANLLLRRVGGPQGFTRFLRDHGDNVTRLDRIEPMLNTNDPGDPRDTTTPEAMISTMRLLLTESVLSAASRERLLNWMIASPTGASRIRAGLPATWRAGDKTGTGRHGAVNDVAIAWPPDRGPLLIAVYMSGSWSANSTLQAAHAEIGRAVASKIG